MKKLILLISITLIFFTSGCSSQDNNDEDRSTVLQQEQASLSELSRLRLPEGFRVGLFASSLSDPRMMALSPDGRLFVTESGGGRVTILPDTNGDGRADSHTVYVSGLNQPHGIVFHDGYLYIAETNRVIRYRYAAGDNKAPAAQVIVSNIPTGGHSTRTITFGPDGKLYLSIGSSCNVCIESNPMRAAITRYNADGSGRQIFAAGLRNAVGLAWNPVTNELWATDNGRDQLGDDIPPEEVNVIKQGGFYGWPYAYGDRAPDPEFGNRAPDKVRSSITPRIKIQAHSAPLGLAFYTGSMFPQEYRGDLFIAYHGSWNRSVPTGYKVVRFNMEGGNVTGTQQNFITGWLQGRESWGRPVGLLVGKYGELYISDDAGGRVLRISYVQP
ncbi:MAG: PQQ-dependent sugar dehydrogenase [Armatimonadota bacterium]